MTRTGISNMLEVLLDLLIEKVSREADGFSPRERQIIWDLSEYLKEQGPHMCRSIKVLRRPDAPVTGEISAAALQFVHKVSGYRKPSKSNRDAFELAVREVADATARLLGTLNESKHPARC